MSVWYSFATNPPKPGDHIVILCDDGCSSAIAFVIDREGSDKIAVLGAEDAWEYDSHFLDGAVWTHIPNDYRIAALEAE